MSSRSSSAWPHPPLIVEAWGPLACFTRPEFKVERMSYPVMTPPAARGLLESIFWKREFAYVITRIDVLAPIEWIKVRRNEVNSVLSSDHIKKLRAGWHYDVAEDRGQRNTVALRDVAYRIHAQVRLADHATEPAAKYRDQLRRRVERGACFQQPYLGCREFAASFGPSGSWPFTSADPAGETRSETRRRTEPLGLMLHSIEYGDDGSERYRWFSAELQISAQHPNGTLIVGDALPDSAVDMPAGTRRSARSKR